jgi:broad specificity phosphatase PhoE
MMTLASASKSPGGDATFFETMLGYVVDVWVNGEVTLPEVESAPQFGKRVRAGLDVILRRARELDQADGGARDRHIAVVTSNGVAGWVAGHAARDAEPERGCLLRRLFNGSISRFAARGETVELLAWNVVDHIADRKLQTVL